MTEEKTRFACLFLFFTHQLQTGKKALGITPRAFFMLESTQDQQSNRLLRSALLQLLAHLGGERAMQRIHLQHNEAENTRLTRPDRAMMSVLPSAIR